MHIVPFYAALLALLLVTLGVRTTRLRRRHKIGIGDGGNQQLLRAIRAHSNCSEYVPLGIVMLFLSESRGAAPLFIHALAAIFLFGRIIHAYGVSQNPEPFKFRVTGTIITFLTLIICSGYLLVSQITH